MLIAALGYSNYQELISTENHAKKALEKGSTLFFKGEFTKAIQTYELALKTFERHKNLSFCAESIYLIAVAYKEIGLLTKESSFLRRFPNSSPLSSIMQGFDFMIKALFAEEGNNWGEAEKNWFQAKMKIKRLIPYQLRCQGALLEIEFQALLRGSDEKSRTTFLTKLIQWQNECEENQITHELCRVYLLRARFMFATDQLDAVQQWYELCISVARKSELAIHIDIAQTELSNFQQHRQQILKLLEEDRPLSPKEQEARFHKYMKQALKSIEDVK
jgi:hypothetical protein